MTDEPKPPLQLSHDVREALAAAGLKKPVPKEMIDTLDLVVKPEVRDAIMIALASEEDVDMDIRVAAVSEEIATAFVNGPDKMGPMQSLAFARCIVESAARRLRAQGNAIGRA